jgi:NAD(P)-dependent dehydrogenase (short-subunit alcohol dehydrogenase family)
VSDLGGLLEGQLALVTGAGRGIGAALVRGLADAGAGIIATDIDPEAAARTADGVRQNGGVAFAYGLDVTNAAQCAACAAAVRRDVAPISILVNNAGIGGELAIDHPDSVRLWDRQIAVNLSGPFYVVRAFLGELRQTRGTIINIASVAAFNAVTAAQGYMASKAGIKLLTQTLAKVLAPDGIRVNAVAPGTVRTELTAARLADPVWSEAFLARVPLRRVAEPEEIVQPILFLASPMASYITGATLPIDGGFLAV